MVKFSSKAIYLVLDVWGEVKEGAVDYWFNVPTYYKLAQKFSFYDSGLVDFMFLYIFLFLLGYLVCWLISFCSSLLWSCFYFYGISCNVSSFVSDFVPLVFSWFFLVSLAKDLSILFVFSKKQTFHWFFYCLFSICVRIFNSFFLLQPQV